MTTPADRLAGWIDKVAASWAARLGKWGGALIAGGIEGFEDVLGKKASKQLLPFLETMEKAGALPVEYKPLLAELRNPTGESAAMFARSLSGAAVSGGFGAIYSPALERAGRMSRKFFRPTYLQPGEMLESALHGRKSWADVRNELADYGYMEADISYLIDLFDVRLPSELVGPAWLRDPAKYEKYWKDVEAGGVTPDRVELMKELQFKMPTVQDVVSWLAHEVFEPDMIAKYGLDDEWDKLDKSLFPKIGLREPMALNYWRNHWQHPAWGQVTEMLHRGHLTEKDVSDWYRLVEIPPHWRDMLTKISYNPYTRVDARRMWDLGVLDDAQLLKAYTDLGYDAEHAKNMTTWTKVYQMTPQLIAQYKNGWLSLKDVKSQLLSFGLSPEKVDWVFKNKFQNESASRTTAQKDLTLAQIIKGVKKDKISRAQGADLLVDMGYDLNEASFILDIEIPADETDIAVKSRELTKADILSGLRQGTITPEQALPKLIAIRYSPTDAAYIIAVYQASITPPATPIAKSLTKADIVSAVKQGLITPEQAYELLVSVGYSDADANFILALVPTTSPFSPVNYDEFKAVTQKWRATQGLEVEENIPEVRDMKLALAKAVVEGRAPDMEQTRIQIDTIRRKRRKGLISRDEEIKQLTGLGVPEAYVKAVVENDDARLVKTA